MVRHFRRGHLVPFYPLRNDAFTRYDQVMRSLFFASVLVACAPGATVGIAASPHELTLVDVSHNETGFVADVAVAAFHGLAADQVANLVGTGNVPELGCRSLFARTSGLAGEDEYFVDLLDSGSVALANAEETKTMVARIFPTLGSIGGVVYRGEWAGSSEPLSVMLNERAVVLQMPEQVSDLRIDGSPLQLGHTSGANLATHTLEWRAESSNERPMLAVFRFGNTGHSWECAATDRGLLNLDGEAAQTLDRADWLEVERVLVERQTATPNNTIQVVTRARYRLDHPSA